MSGTFIVIDGPSGVGKSTITHLLARRLCEQQRPTVVTRQPSSGLIGVLARAATHQVNGLALACLVAADRYHHLDVEIRPALASGYTVVCDRYLPSSLVLQHLDGVPDAMIWNLNAHIERPDLTILLRGAPERCQLRARQRGTYSRFHGGIAGESQRYEQLVPVLNEAGYPTIGFDSGQRSPEEVAQSLCDQVQARVPVGD